jgi:Mg/Co/Ni transporter MgtE
MMRDAVIWLSDRFVERYPTETARAIEPRPIDEVAVWLAELPTPTATAILVRMHTAAAADCVCRMSTEQATPLLEQMPPEVAARIVRYAGPPATDRLLEAIPRAAAATIRRLARYRQGTIGAIVETHAPALPGDTLVSDARKSMRASTLPYLYVLDRDHHLVGVVGSAQWSARPDQHIASIMQGTVTCLDANVETSAIISHPGWTEFDALPVVDGERRFLGILRHKTLRRVLGARATGAGDNQMVATLLRLAEVYWVGVSATLASLQLGTAPSLQPNTTMERGVTDGTR